MSDHRKTVADRCDNWPRNWNAWTSNSRSPNVDNRKEQTVHRQSLADKPSSGQTETGNTRGCGRGFRRTNSMPTKTSTSPIKDMFTLDMEDDIDLDEAVALAAAADAAEATASQLPSKLPAVTHIKIEKKECDMEAEVPSTSKAPPLATDYRNGSSGFDVLFAEEIADEDVEECMLLATAYSQDVQQSQNASVVGNTTLSQAYNFFSKGVPAHSSILEPSKDDFKKPLPNRIFPAAQNRACTGSGVPTTASSAPRDKFNYNSKPSNQASVNRHAANIPGPSINKHPITGNGSATVKSLQQPDVNPVAETEVRRLILAQEKILADNKRLKESLRTKEGEAAILRSQLKQAQSDILLQKTTNARTVAASQQHYGERVRDLEKEIDKMRTNLQFKEAETQEARERVRMLSNTQRVKLVEPKSPRASGPVAPETTSARRGAPQRHVSSFLNRSTFEDVIKPVCKRPRLSEDNFEGVPANDLSFVEPKPHQPDLKPNVEKIVTENIVSSAKTQGVEDSSWILDPVLPSAGQALLERLGGRQLIPVESSDLVLKNSCELEADDWDTGRTLSLLSLKPRHSKMKRRALSEKQRPSLIHCSDALRQLMSWREPSLDSTVVSSVIIEVFQECCGIVHYHTILMCDGLETLTHKQLAERDKDLIQCGSQIIPLNQEYDLLDNRQWYKEEVGVEVRLCLGVLSEIVAVSQFAAYLITGAVENQKQTLKKHSFYQLPEFAPEKEESSDPFWFLQVLLNLCETIVEQKLTIAMNGVLTGVVILIRNCAQQGAVVGEGCSVVLSIIREVLLCRPASTVLLRLVELLHHLSNCEEIMGGLCSNCDEDDCEEKLSEGLCYFTKNACLLQLLCVQLQSFSGSHQWCLADAVVRWLLAVLAQGWTTPHWISPSFPYGETEKLPVHTMCCLRLTSTLVALLYDTFLMLRANIERQEASVNSTIKSVSLQQENNIEAIPHSTLICTMQRSILLLHDLFLKGMDKYMGSVEGLYELLICGINQIQEHLCLAPIHVKRLKALVSLEEQGMPHSVTSSQSTSSESYWRGILASSLNSQ